MKILIGAIALTIAVPVFGQAAPAPDPHAGHAEHQKGKHDCKECCEKMKGKDGKMDCMKDEAEKGGSKQDHQGHETHAH